MSGLARELQRLRLWGQRKTPLKIEGVLVPYTCKDIARKMADVQGPSAPLPVMFEGGWVTIYVECERLILRQRSNAND